MHVKYVLPMFEFPYTFEQTILGYLQISGFEI